jgi:hypothetical protein
MLETSVNTRGILLLLEEYLRTLAKQTEVMEVMAEVCRTLLEESAALLPQDMEEVQSTETPLITTDSPLDVEDMESTPVPISPYSQPPLLTPSNGLVEQRLQSVLACQHQWTLPQKLQSGMEFQACTMECGALRYGGLIFVQAVKLVM